MKTLVRLVAFAALSIACAWAWQEPKFDSWAAAAGAAVVFLGLFFVPSASKPSGQSQQTGSGGVGIQAGRDVRVNIRDERKDS